MRCAFLAILSFCNENETREEGTTRKEMDWKNIAAKELKLRAYKASKYMSKSVNHLLYPINGMLVISYYATEEKKCDAY